MDKKSPNSYTLLINSIMSLLSCRIFFIVFHWLFNFIRWKLTRSLSYSIIKYVNSIQTQCLVYLIGFYLKYEDNNTVSFIQSYLRTDFVCRHSEKRLDDKIRMAFGFYFILFIHKPEVHKIPGQLGRGDICIICIMSMVGGWHIRDSIYKVWSLRLGRIFFLRWFRWDLWSSLIRNH